jgi:hypothetical protein
MLNAGADVDVGVDDTLRASTGVTDVRFRPPRPVVVPALSNLLEYKGNGIIGK